MALFELAALVTLLPLVAGAALARLPRVTVTTPVVALAWLVAATWLRIGAWDALWIAGAFVAGAAAATGVRRRGGLVVAVPAIAILVALGIAELATHASPLPVPFVNDRFVLPVLDPASIATSGLSPDLSRPLQACGLAFPKQFPDIFSARVPDDLRPVTLVLGDSMTAGLDRDTSRTWPADWQRHAPDTAIVSTALVGASVDLHLAVLARWKPLLGTRLKSVVLQLFVNDVDELERPWPCCNDRPLLRFDDAAHLACDVPEWSGNSPDSFVRRIDVSPLPLAVRALAGTSQLARHALGAHTRWQTRIPDSTDTPELRARRFEATLAAIRSAAGDTPLLAVVMPWRPLLDPADPQHDLATMKHDALLQAASHAGLRVYDPTPPLAVLLRNEGPDAVFLPGGEHHFAARAHEVLATSIAAIESF